MKYLLPFLFALSGCSAGLPSNYLVPIYQVDYNNDTFKGFIRDQVRETLKRDKEFLEEAKTRCAKLSKCSGLDVKPEKDGEGWYSCIVTRNGHKAEITNCDQE